jgi:Tol biopolymer transport system component
VDFAWPSADRVLFVTRAGAIVSAKLDGSDRRAIDVGRPASGAAVSRDGSMLFYFGRSEAGAGAGLYAARADGTGTRPIDAKRARAEGVATSSDLARLAWATERERGGGPGAIVVASTEGRGVRPITPEAAAARAPTFHPNSRTIGFASDRDASAFEVYVADVTTGSEADLPLAERVTFSQGDLPSFSADGAHLAFASRRGGATLDLYVARWIEDP